MKNNNFLYICIAEILIVYIMHVNSYTDGKKYTLPKANTKYISTHNIRHKHHYVNRTLAVKNKPNHNSKPLGKVHVVMTTTAKPLKLKTGAKRTSPVDSFSLKHTLHDVTLKKPIFVTPKETTTKASPLVLKEGHVQPMDTTIDLLDLPLTYKLFNNEDRIKLNDLSNTNNLAPPTFDFATKSTPNVNEENSGKSPPYFDQYLQKDSPHFMQPIRNTSSNGSIMKIDDLVSKGNHFMNDNNNNNDDEDEDDEEDDDIADDEDEDDNEDDIAVFDDELTTSTLASTSRMILTTTALPSTTARSSKDVNDSAETSKLNMVRSRSVPFRAEYAGFKTVRSPPSLESPTTEDSVQNLQRLAFKHKMKVVKDAACRKPMPKVIKVSDVYPSATKIYLPQCTIIHQCAEDTGCCSGPFEKCGPKSSEKVDLYFYTYSTSSIVRGASPHQIEKLGFYNHTECECHEDMPRDDSNVMENETKSVTESPPALEEPCFCPTDYTVRRFLNGSCGCDCFDKDRNCLRFKKGKEYLSLKDKWCIKTGKCHTPSCEYGKYSAKVGRCPRQNEKSRFF